MTGTSTKTSTKKSIVKSDKLTAPSKAASPLPTLTEKEMAVLSLIEQSLLERGISPSYQEIKDHFGFASFNSVQNYLKQLTNKGYIINPANQKRGIQVLHSADSVQKIAQSLRPAVRPQAQASAPTEAITLPLLGKVAAGRPLESFSHDEFVDVPPSLVRNPDKTFALRIAGSSMIEDGIHDGDIILVQKQSQVSNGEIVVASVENESTVKRFFLRPHPDLKEKMIELRPANSTMSSMWYPPDRVDVQGVLVGLIRKF